MPISARLIYSGNAEKLLRLSAPNGQPFQEEVVSGAGPPPLADEGRQFAHN